VLSTFILCFSHHATFKQSNQNVILLKWDGYIFQIKCRSPFCSVWQRGWCSSSCNCRSRCPSWNGRLWVFAVTTNWRPLPSYCWTAVPPGICPPCLELYENLSARGNTRDVVNKSTAQFMLKCYTFCVKNVKSTHFLFYFLMSCMTQII
jgi:hypothetical protein